MELTIHKMATFLEIKFTLPIFFQIHRIAVVTWVPILCAWNTSAKIKQTSAGNACALINIVIKIFDFCRLWNIYIHLQFRFKGVRDDLNFLLEEELTSVNLCALHCELRNTEQLLSSLGLYSYNIGALKQCNKILSAYGPETTGDRITVKLKEGQQSAVTKHNIKVASFSGKKMYM